MYLYIDIYIFILKHIVTFLSSATVFQFFTVLAVDLLIWNYTDHFPFVSACHLVLDRGQQTTAQEPHTACSLCCK